MRSIKTILIIGQWHRRRLSAVVFGRPAGWLTIVPLRRRGVVRAWHVLTAVLTYLNNYEKTDKSLREHWNMLKFAVTNPI